MNKIAVIDERANKKIFKKIESLGFEALPFKVQKNISVSCSGHPDISLFRLSKNKIIYAPGTDEVLLRRLWESGVTLIEGKKVPEAAYPGEVRYNAVVIGNYLFHRIDITDEQILKEAEKEGLEKVSVRQGYTGCSVSLIRSNVIITSDTGIHRAAISRNIDSLLLPPQKNIKLSGAAWGFIGGATGRIDDYRLAFAGDARQLESYDIIRDYLDSKNVEIISLGDDEVADLGSLMFFTL